MKRTKMEFIREELVKRGIIQNGFVGEINPTLINIEYLGIKITEQSKDFCSVEDEKNRTNFLSDNKHYIIDYVVNAHIYY